LETRQLRFFHAASNTGLNHALEQPRPGRLQRESFTHRSRPAGGTTRKSWVRPGTGRSVTSVGAMLPHSLDTGALENINATETRRLSIYPCARIGNQSQDNFTST
jgi:hypothetical protein